MGKVLSAISSALKAAKDFVNEIYRFFTVRRRLLKKMEKVNSKIDDMIEEKNDLERRLQYGEAMIEPLVVEANGFLDRVRVLVNMAKKLYELLESEGKLQLYYNEDHYTEKIDDLESYIDQTARSVRIFLKHYANAADDKLRVMKLSYNQPAYQGNQWQTQPAASSSGVYPGVYQQASYHGQSPAAAPSAYQARSTAGYQPACQCQPAFQGWQQNPMIREEYTSTTMMMSTQRFVRYNVMN